jgi:hypothetical protein
VILKARRPFFFGSDFLLFLEFAAKFIFFGQASILVVVVVAARRLLFVATARAYFFIRIIPNQTLVGDTRRNRILSDDDMIIYSIAIQCGWYNKKVQQSRAVGPM